jgi:hypothetical protein
MQYVFRFHLVVWIAFGFIRLIVWFIDVLRVFVGSCVVEMGWKTCFLVKKNLVGLIFQPPSGGWIFGKQMICRLPQRATCRLPIIFFYIYIYIKKNKGERQVICLFRKEKNNKLRCTGLGLRPTHLSFSFLCTFFVFF